MHLITLALLRACRAPFNGVVALVVILLATAVIMRSIFGWRLCLPRPFLPRNIPFFAAAASFAAGDEKAFIARIEGAAVGKASLFLGLLPT